MVFGCLVRESFSHTPEFVSLEVNCRAFAAEFVNCRNEFFYYLAAGEKERFFFIRSDTRERDKFIQAARHFARNLNFEILSARETKRTLIWIKLDTFE